MNANSNIIITQFQQMSLNTIITQFRQMSLIEVSAALTALICIVLLMKNNIWNWLWGIVSVILYAWVFWKFKLYLNLWLQILYFLPTSFYGWWVWAKFGPNRSDDLPITMLSMRQRGIWTGITILLCAGMAFAVKQWSSDDPLPYTDAITTGFSIVAQYFQARKYYENWWMWILADVIYVFYMFPQEHAYASTVLYIVFTVLSFMGMAEWRKRLRLEMLPGQAGRAQVGI